MKIFLPFFRTITTLTVVVVFTGCLKDSVTRTYTILRPEFRSRTEILASIKSGVPETLQSPGKIFIKGNYLFINEVNKGVHVYDNSNPSSPKAKAFINIPGNIDIGMKDNILYADMYEDLIALNINDPMNVQVIKTVSGVFPSRNYGGAIVPGSDMVIVGWISKDTVVSADFEENNWACPNCLMEFDMANASVKGTIVPGIAGSMARFTIVDDYLYALKDFSLGVYDIANPADIQIKGEPYVGGGIETVYPFEGKLFIGSATGLFIYSLNQPAVPVKEGEFSHARACDPVIADGNYAFVTLRTGNICTGTSNQLDVVNVQNISSPSLVKTYPLTNPHGLAKDGDLLFICDGEDGLKIFDASDVYDIKLIRHLNGMDAYDAIAWNKKLILVASNGLYQYDYSNSSNIRLLSTIATSRPGK